MRQSLRTLLAVVSWAGTCGPACAWTLPSITGQLAGGVETRLLAGAPPIAWKVEALPGPAGARPFRLEAKADGLDLRCEVTVDEATQDGGWKLTAASLDMGRWFPVLRGRLGTSAASLVARGTLQLKGEGSLKQGVPAGIVTITWTQGVLQDAAGSWQLEGVELNGEFAFDAAAKSLRSTQTATLGVATISTSRFGARSLAMKARLIDLATLMLESATVEIAGGDMNIAPTRVPLKPVDITADLELRRVGLQDVAALVPGSVRDARGRIDGKVRLSWSEQKGFDVGAGKLTLHRDEPAQVTLKPTPGLITGALKGMSRKIVTYFYPGLEKVERGELAIAAESLEVTLTPAGDAEGRTAVVHLSGGPADPTNRAPIDLTVNVRAPLKALIDFGTAKGVHFK